jgi:hypothetical protein
MQLERGERIVPVFLPLTKREEFAKAALQGLLANPTRDAKTFTAFAHDAVAMADALIAELNKPTT